MSEQPPVEAGGDDTSLDLEQHLAVPYRLQSYSARLDDGEWTRVVEYPELACIAWADSAIDAMEQADRERVSMIVSRYRSGMDIPVPRRPLNSLLSEARRMLREHDRGDGGASRANGHNGDDGR